MKEHEREAQEKQEEVVEGGRQKLCDRRDDRRIRKRNKERKIKEEKQDDGSL